MAPSITLDKIKETLNQSFHPTFLEVKDESARHAGHAGARQGGGHYQVEIVSVVFEGLNLIEQHRRVHEALRDLMKVEIHALQLKTSAPSSKKRDLAIARSL